MQFNTVTKTIKEWFNNITVLMFDENKKTCFLFCALLSFANAITFQFAKNTSKQ